jgi:hypothetical protein
VALIGEIFTIIEPFSNLYIEDKLMDYGVSTTRMLTPSWWLKNMALKPLGLYARRVYRASDAYMPFPVGGHGKECVGEAVLADARMDGAIQIFPLGCMPEVIAKSISRGSGDRDFRLDLIVDEVTARRVMDAAEPSWICWPAGTKADLLKRLPSQAMESIENQNRHEGDFLFENSCYLALTTAL